MLNPLLEIRYQKNSKRLLGIISDLLTEYEKDFPPQKMIPSCKSELMKLIKESVKDSFHDEIATWKDFDTDYIKISHVLIIQTINTIVDNYNENHGINLTDKYLMPSYQHVLHHCVDWAFDHGDLTRDEYNYYGFTTR